MPAFFPSTFRNKPQPVLKQKQMSKNPTPHKQHKHNLVILVACTSTVLSSFPPLSKHYAQLRQHSGKRRISSPGIKTNASLDRSPPNSWLLLQRYHVSDICNWWLDKTGFSLSVSQIYHDHFQFWACHLKHLQLFPAWHQLKIQMV